MRVRAAFKTGIVIAELQIAGKASPEHRARAPFTSGGKISNRMSLCIGKVSTGLNFPRFSWPSLQLQFESYGADFPMGLGKEGRRRDMFFAKKEKKINCCVDAVNDFHKLEIIILRVQGSRR